MAVAKMANNPTAAINQMASQNPQMKQVLDYINSNGGDAKTAFYKMAQEMGVDPNTVLSQLQ